MTLDDSSFTNSPISASMSMCVCVFRIARVHSLPWSFILIMANHCINGMFLIDARGLVMKSFVFFPRLEVVCCL